MLNHDEILKIAIYSKSAIKKHKNVASVKKNIYLENCLSFFRNYLHLFYIYFNNKIKISSNK